MREFNPNLRASNKDLRIISENILIALFSMERTAAMDCTALVVLLVRYISISAVNVAFPCEVVHCAVW